MSTFNEEKITLQDTSRVEQQQLEFLYGYYNRNQQMQKSQQDAKNKKQNNEDEQKHEQQQQIQQCLYEEHNLYDGCQYDSESCFEEKNQVDYQENEEKGVNFYEGEKQQKRQDEFLLNEYQRSQGLSNSFTQKSKSNEYHSQPTSLGRWQNQRSLSHSSNIVFDSFSQSMTNRSINALVSNQKKTKKVRKVSKAVSQKSLSISSNSARNKIIQFQKEKKKNGDHTIEPIFFNPLASLPNEAMNIDEFLKFYKMSFTQIEQKVNGLQKKLVILGEKSFFKDKENEQVLDEIFKYMGMKSSSKMGKAKAFRQFKALQKYLNSNTSDGSAQKENRLGQGANMIDPIYLSQFKALMGYVQNEEEKTSASKKSLFGYGFGKPQRKH